MKLSVVIPVYNSEPIVPELMRRLSASLGRLAEAGDYEVIFVNDCSGDRSWDAIARACEEYPCARGINLRRNAGQHNAIMAGLRHASGDLIVVMDDDLQHSPEDIGKLCAKIHEGYDVCYAAFRETKHPAWKRLGTAFRDATAVALLGMPPGLGISSFKAMSADLAREAARYEGPFPYLDGLLLMATRNIVNVEVEHQARVEGPSNYGFRESIFLWTKVAMNFSVLPLRIASWLGLGFAVLGFALTVYLVVDRFVFGNVQVPGWSSLIVTILVMGGVQLLALGAIGEYLGRAFVDMSGKPQYVVKAKKGFQA